MTNDITTAHFSFWVFILFDLIYIQKHILTHGQKTPKQQNVNFVLKMNLLQLVLKQIFV